MAWISIEEDDVKTRLAGTELSSYQTVALASGQSDPLPGIITQVVSEIRGYIAACASNALGDGETIPEKLLGTALAVIRYRLTTRLPIEVTEQRELEYKEAIRLLERVSECMFAIEEPEEEDDESISSPSPNIGSRTRNFDSDDQDGI